MTTADALRFLNADIEAERVPRQHADWRVRRLPERRPPRTTRHAPDRRDEDSGAELPPEAA